MAWRGWVVIVYGLVILLGGVIGYAKAHSMASLVMGLGSAVVLLACGWGIFARSVYAYYVALALSWGLTLFFGYRLIMTGKFMPAGMMAIMSVLVAGILQFSQSKDPIISDKSR